MKAAKRNRKRDRGKGGAKKKGRKQPNRTQVASEQRDDKVTICHRTNAENNPYVVITVDKASLFKRGHDTHDEGGVYQPGDKARGVRWGDIIPAFDYFASPKDQRDGTVSREAAARDLTLEARF